MVYSSSEKRGGREKKKNLLLLKYSIKVIGRGENCRKKKRGKGISPQLDF